MGIDVNYNTLNYRDQKEFDYFFATAFDRYDTNRDGVIDYREFQPLINDMIQIITKKYGYGPSIEKIRAAWSTLDMDRNGYLTRNEFSTKARYELERILTQPDYIPRGYNPGNYSGNFPGNYNGNYSGNFSSGYNSAQQPPYQSGYNQQYSQGGYSSTGYSSQGYQQNYPPVGCPPAGYGGFPQNNFSQGYSSSCSNNGGYNNFPGQGFNNNYRRDRGFSSNVQGQGF